MTADVVDESTASTSAERARTTEFAEFRDASKCGGEAD